MYIQENLTIKIPHFISDIFRNKTFNPMSKILVAQYILWKTIRVKANVQILLDNIKIFFIIV